MDKTDFLIWVVVFEIAVIPFPIPRPFSIEPATVVETLTTSKTLPRSIYHFLLPTLLSWISKVLFFITSSHIPNRIVNVLGFKI